MAKAKIVSFDGHDCVGKTSLMSATVHALSEKGLSVTMFRSVNKDFETERLRHSEVSQNIWFYVSAWLNTEKEILKSVDSTNFIFIDRSYYSTMVLAGALDLYFPHFLLQTFLKPDYAFWVQVSEEERMRRLERKRATREDYITVNATLISKADLIYTSLGLLPLNNEGPLQDGAQRLSAILLR
ncbi:MAG: hypothetical protein WBL19_01620 [Minisyncoccia bacterium]